jgi:cytochrome oxidase assembly protein ShyY1
MRALFTKRWLKYLALAVVFAIACVCLAFWQLARREEATARIQLVETNWDAAALPVSEVLPDLGAFDADRQWQPVELHGRYLTDEQLLARGRPFDGNPGFEVLVPFQLDDGSVFIVDRGWVPVGNDQDSPDVVPAPPSGVVTVVARLKPSEPVLPGRSAPEGQVASIELPGIAELLDEPTYVGAYGLLVSEDPGVATRPQATPRPEADEGPHLSYAFQWFLFAILGFVGLGVAIRQDLRDPDAPPRPKRRTDADIEDDLVDQAAQAKATKSA